MKNIIKYLVVAIAATVLAISASAAVTTLDLVPYDETNNQWEVTFHINLELDESVTDSHVNTFAAYFFFNPEKLVLCDTAYNEITDYYSAGITPVYCYPVKSGRNEYSYSVIPSNTNGVSNMWIPQENGTVRGYVTVNTLQEYFDSNDNLMFSVAFKFADGVTKDDLVASDFVVQQLYAEDTYTGTYGYKYQDPSAIDTEMDCVNNVVPEATVITIPVQAGDKIYMNGDGTFVTAEEACDYVVPANAGYVAVNTGYTAQKTYFVDSTSATLVHENGVLIRDGQYNVRASKSSDEAEYGEDRSGLRFFMDHAIAGRTVENHEIVEVGYVMTAESNKVINNNGKGENYILDMNMVDSGFANSGYAFNTDNGTDFAFETGDDTYIITGVFYNIPMNAVQIPIAARAYYRVGDTYIYGEVTKTTLYEEAVKIKEGNFDSLTEEAQDYINEIIAQVDGEETPIVEDEVIIDITGLYGV